MDYEYLVFPSADGWRVALRDDPQLFAFDDFASAERRARWLAARASVKGHDSRVLLLDEAGELVGVWRAEHYAPANPPSRSLAA